MKYLWFCYFYIIF